MRGLFLVRRCGSWSFLFLMGWMVASAFAAAQSPENSKQTDSSKQEEKKKLARATFGGGCFWCTEAVFQRVKGVESVVSGYAGGTVENPTYEQVCTGETGHAEAVEVIYDKRKVDYAALARLFLEIHDPTQLNRQGPDYGSQYRSAIFYYDEEQQRTAARLIGILRGQGIEAVTRLEPAGRFWPAEDYHQDYYSRKKSVPYCHARVKRFRDDAAPIPPAGQR